MTNPQPMQPFVSARGRSTAVTMLVVVQLALMGLATLAWIGGAGRLDEDLTGAASAFATAAALESMQFLVFIATAVVFLSWVHRAVANLPALGSTSGRFSPEGAVWSWLIPFVNLVRSHQVMATIWHESQPPAVNQHGDELPARMTLVNAWWGLFFASFVANLASSSASPFGVVELRSLADTQIELHLLRMAVAVLFVLMVRGAQSRQDEQWLDLERRRNVPQPSPDALR